MLAAGEGSAQPLPLNALCGRERPGQWWAVCTWERQGLTLLCGRNCQALMSDFASFLLYTASLLLTRGRSHAQTGSVGAWVGCSPHASCGCLRLLHTAPSPLFWGSSRPVCCWLREAWGLLAPNDLLSVSAARPPNTQSCMRRRRWVKHRRERPPLQHGSARDPGSTASRSPQHTVQSCCTRTPRAGAYPVWTSSAEAALSPLLTGRCRCQDSSLWQDACLDAPPERDQQRAGQGHHPELAQPGTACPKPALIPLGEGTSRLKAAPGPGDLNGQRPDMPMARFGDPQCTA